MGRILLVITLTSSVSVRHSEDYIAFIFSVYKYAKQETSRSRLQAVLLFDTEDGGGAFLSILGVSLSTKILFC
jgi:hypothetical protein